MIKISNFLSGGLADGVTEDKDKVTVHDYSLRDGSPLEGVIELLHICQHTPGQGEYSDTTNRNGKFCCIRPSLNLE